MSDFINMIKGMRTLSAGEKGGLELLSDYMSSSNLTQMEKLIKQKRASIRIADCGMNLFKKRLIPILSAVSKEPIVHQLVDDANEEIRFNFRKKMFKEVASNAHFFIPNFIAPNIAGLTSVKRAVALQLFAKDNIHILLMGDPSTGKTDILRSACDYAPINSFGLGSGTSGVGLVATVKGSEVIKGILPMADLGLCCIDELNLMKEESRAGLYNAMEKGFVTYDKGGHHYKFNARVNVLSTANPKGDRFVGDSVRRLKTQLPFDSALLSRFHLVFFVRRPNLKEFTEISKAIVSKDNPGHTQEDIIFVKEYIRHAMEEHDKIEFPKELEPRVVNFIAELKRNEESFLIDITPRLTVGFMRMCTASARMHMRDKVNEDDLHLVANTIRQSLAVD